MYNIEMRVTIEDGV